MYRTRSMQDSNTEGSGAVDVLKNKGAEALNDGSV
jgi:hypothetical protein